MPSTLLNALRVLLLPKTLTSLDELTHLIFPTTCEAGMIIMFHFIFGTKVIELVSGTARI